MKPKHEVRAPAKNAPKSGKAKPGKAAVTSNNAAKSTTALASSKSDFDDVADLFSTIKQTKALKHDTDSGPATAAPHRAKKVSVSSPAGKGSSAAASASTCAAAAAAKPVRDGLYHAPQKSVQMSDNVFFSGTWLKADHDAAASAALASNEGISTGNTEASQDVLRQEGVNRIVSMEELTKMLSRGSRAGTTPNCPFDCDCCF